MCPTQAAMQGAANSAMFARCSAGISAAVCHGPAAGGPIQTLLASNWPGLWRSPGTGRLKGSTLHVLVGRGLGVQAAVHVAVGCLCLGGVLAVACKTERSLWAQMRALRRR